MPLNDLPYNSLPSLISKNLSKKEYPSTVDIKRQLSSIHTKKCLSKEDLILICRWKSPRALKLIKSNSTKKIERITKEAFKTRSERMKIELLTSLRGVSIPMASAILMFKNQKSYGVIDIRVWQLLYYMETVSCNPSGLNFTFNQWYQYLSIIRYYAKKKKVNARDIERTLFNVHSKYQVGNLYE